MTRAGSARSGDRPAAEGYGGGASMKVGMNMLLWTTDMGEELFPLFGQLKELGYDGVEIPIFRRNDAHFQRVRRALESVGLEATAVVVVTPAANPIDSDPAVRAAAVEVLKSAAHTASVVGARLLCGPIHSPVGCRSGSGRGRKPVEWEWAVETLREAAEAAGQVDVTLAIEYLNRFETYFLNTAADTRRLVDEVAHPRLVAMYDTFHANIEERDIGAAVAVLAPVLGHVHISENHRGTPGEGLVQWRETFRALKDARYDGWLTVEAFGRALPDLAAATCVWRDLFESEDQLARDAIRFIRERWSAN
jgi:D-psicose/D-tagatose/L-ribulose 3-epimerase